MQRLDPTEDSSAPPIIIVDAEYELLANLVSGAFPATEGLALLRRELDRASILPGSQAPTDLVRIDAHVHLEGADRRRIHRKLVLRLEAGAPHAVPVTTGLGAAMLGLRPGQTFSWRGADLRPRKIRILEVQAPMGPRIVRSPR